VEICSCLLEIVFSYSTFEPMTPPLTCGVPEVLRRRSSGWLGLTTLIECQLAPAQSSAKSLCVSSKRRTRAISSVGEFDGIDIQRHTEVDRPPRVRRLIGMNTVRVVRVVVAIVSVLGVINEPFVRVDVRAAEVRRTI